MAESMRYETFIIYARDSSHIYTYQGVNCRTFYANVRHCPLTSRPRGGSCDEPPTKLGRARVEGPGPHPPPVPAREAPSGHPAGAVGGGAEECVCRSAQHRRLPPAVVGRAGQGRAFTSKRSLVSFFFSLTNQHFRSVQMDEEFSFFLN